eukprot:m.70664 g.70664  ORF g.70664 m.70664 type:complete len:389 (+) comp14083_c3_seq1:97-1263(+)
MKLLFRSIDRDKSGEVGLMPLTAEDMWHAYNLIQTGDRLKATTIRKVSRESTTGSVNSTKVRTTLTLEVLNVEFDTEACTLRVAGRNVAENQYVKMGAHHTIDMELNRKFTLFKPEWDSVALDRVGEACDVARSADLGAIVMQEGLAYVCLVTPNMTVVRSKLELSIPRKRRGDCSQHDKALVRFYDNVYEALLRHIDFSVIKSVLVASPGFLRDQFLEHVFSTAIKTDCKKITENRSKFVSVHSSSGHLHALHEVLADPTVASQLADTKAAGEVAVLNKFFMMLNDKPDQAFYGLKHVQRANDALAVDTLMITDKLFRSKDVAERRRYVQLVDSVRDNGGQVRVFSSLHVSGEQLGQFSGVAAILRFPLLEIEHDSDTDSDASDDDP